MITKTLAYATVTLCLSLGLGGCFQFQFDRVDDEEPAADARTPTTGPTGTGWITEMGQAELLQGTMGTVARFQSTAPQMQIRRRSTSTSSSAYVRLDAESASARWWAMTALTITGGLAHASLRPGAHLTFTTTSPSQSGLRVSVLGCSGPMRDRFTYDRTADRVDVDVMQGSEPGRRRMVYTAQFTNGTERQTVQGSFEYDPQ